jgi:hypothetical protein
MRILKFSLKNVLTTVVCFVIVIMFSSCQKDKDKDVPENVEKGELTIKGLPVETILGREIVEFNVTLFQKGTTVRLVSYNPYTYASQLSYTSYPLANGTSTTNVFDLYKEETSENWNDSGNDIVVLLAQVRFCGAYLNYKIATVKTIANGKGEVNYDDFTPLVVSE